MKTKPIIFLILSMVSLGIGLFFAFASISSPGLGKIGIPTALVCFVIGLTNGMIYHFTRELIKKLDLDD